jgi:oligopeptide transport system permease protein
VSAPDTERGHSLWSDAWHRLRSNRLALGGGILLVVLAVACAAGPFFSQSYEEQNLDLGAVPPSGAHWLGTDTLGRDLLARTLYGGRISITVGPRRDLRRAGRSASPTAPSPASSGARSTRS